MDSREGSGKVLIAFLGPKAGEKSLINKSV
jgi:hypothetical protein